MKYQKVEHVDRFHCDECKSLMMATPSGAVCPNNHGKLRPHVTEQDLIRYERARKRWEWFQSLPVLTPKNEKAKHPRIFLHGDKAVIRCTATVNGTVKRSPKFTDVGIVGAVVARFGDRPVFVKDKPAKELATTEQPAKSPMLGHKELDRPGITGRSDQDDLSSVRKVHRIPMARSEVASSKEVMKPEIPAADDPQYRRTCTRCGDVRNWTEAFCAKCGNPEFSIPPDPAL